MAINRSAWRALAMLELFAGGDALSLSDVQQALDIPKSSAFDLLETLQSFGAVELYDPQLKTYVMGSRMLGLSRAARQQSLYRHAHAELEKLSLESGHTAYLAVERDDRIVYLDKVEAPKPIALTCDVGDRNYLHATGLGKALLAAKSADELAMLPEQFPALTEHTLTEKAALLSELAEIRRRGYALDLQEGVNYVKCVAAPIRNGHGEAVAAISLALLANEFAAADPTALAAAVRATALAISRRLGYGGQDLY